LQNDNNQTIYEYDRDFNKKKLIYNYLKEEFIKNIDPHTKLYVIQNLRPWFYDQNNITEKDKFYLNQVIPFFSTVWAEKYYNPEKYAKEYMINLDHYKFPYLHWECDYHYSHLGVDFFSEYLFNLISDNK